MKLPKEEYQALEDIVGQEYISQDPVIMETYNQVWGNKLFFGEKHSICPAAVLLPANTSEIQAIVKACNRYGILFKPFSSGFEFVAIALEKEKGILLDLKRMNRILEIDAKNMHAVVEPYVPIYRLQMEAAKYGLYYGRVGVGYSAGVIATSCCHHGAGETSVSTSYGGRNVLGVEWVLPTGELLKLGTCGAGDGWFSTYGPGFSLRGILRGRGGANGGHGVITKASVKLYPWYGPPEWEQVREAGEPLSRGHIEKVLDGYKVFILTFPTMDNMMDACVEIAQAEVAYLISPGDAWTQPVPPGNDEAWAAAQKSTPEARETIEKSLTVIIGNSSGRALAYREKCVLAISEKWGGKLLPQFNQPNGLAQSFLTHIWSIGIMALRATGDFWVGPGLDCSQGMIRTEMPIEDEAMAPYIKSGAFHLMRKRLVIYHPVENHSIGGHGGQGYFYDPHDPVSLEATRKYTDETFDPQGKFRSYGVPTYGGILQLESINHIHQNWGPLYDNYDIWLRKIKKMLDPNNVADWLGYIPSEYA